ncbi:MAG: bifunctional oligoribonuclease/PAP phosphatase NrnA [Ignavibacteriales bacterium]|nr:bifunctional oligoribonuclease/PAP phosphatase NrnA [Ignavibacteriales bacterium]
MIDFLLLKRIISENNSFLLSTHVNPDADAIGSEIAFCQILKKLGKTVNIINHSKTPYYLEFLDPENIIQKFDVEKHAHLFDEVDVLVALDLNSSNRLVKIEKYFNQSIKLKICIDHHQHPEEFVNYFFLDSSYSATGHIIFRFIKETNIVDLTKNIAVPIYAAIMTDLGSFRFDRTTSKIHHIIAELLDAGADPVDIYDKIYDQSNFSKIKLLGETLSSIQLNHSKEIAYMVVTQEAVLRTGADESEVDGFVNYCLSIKEVKIGLLFFEMKDGVKISLRSKGTIPVNLLAEEFGGGGHTNAAGTRLFDIRISEILTKIINRAEYYLNQ